MDTEIETKDNLSSYKKIVALKQKNEASKKILYSNGFAAKFTGSSKIVIPINTTISNFHYSFSFVCKIIIDKIIIRRK